MKAAAKVERVVLVDDDRLAVRMFTLGVPQTVGLFAASDAELAQDLCKRHRPDLVIVDLPPRTEDRLSWLAALKEVSPETHVVVTSAYASIDLAVRAMRAGADDVIAKPVSFGEIVRRMHQEKSLALTAPSLERVQWEHAQRVFRDCGDNMTHAAQQLGVPRSTLRRWITRPAPRA